MLKTVSVFFMLLLLSTAQAAKIPEFRLKDLDNRRVSFSDIKGEHLTILDFWATWCKPCVRSIPELIELHKTYTGKGVQVVGINVDSPRNTPKVKPFARSLGVNYTVLLDINSELSQQLQITVLPTLLIVDAEGEIVYIHQGYRPGDMEILASKLDQLLEKSEENE